MARRKATVTIDEAVFDAARAAARREGRTEDEVIEEALRRHLEKQRPSVVHEVWARNAAAELTPEQVLEMAYDELRAVRAERQGREREAG